MDSAIQRLNNWSQVYIHVHSKQDKTAIHLDHVTQDLGDWPPEVIVDKENCKPSAAISSVGLEKRVNQRASRMRQDTINRMCQDKISRDAVCMQF